MQNLSEILKAPNLIISEILIKNIPKDLSLNDFLVFLELINNKKDFFDCSQIANSLGLKEEEVMTSFNNLILKEIIQYKTTKENNQIKEIIQKKGKDYLYQIGKVSFNNYTKLK